MSDDMSADFGLDAPSDGSSDSITADQLSDEIFNNDSVVGGGQINDDLFGDHGTTPAQTDPSAGNGGSGAVFADSTAPAGVNANFSGTEFYAGQAILDSDGDGVADTAVQDYGYQVEYYVDNDGDGQADELTITDADGNLVSHTQLVEGTDATWQETAAPDVKAGDMSVSDNVGPSGYVDPSAPAPPVPEASDAPQPPAPEGGQDAAPAPSEDDAQLGSAHADEGAPSDSGSDIPPADSGSDSTGADEAASDAASSSGESSSDVYVAGGDLTVTIDGQTYDVGAPTLDITGDGTADTVVVEQDGNVEYYVDTDQDGVADQIIVLDEADGSLINHEVYDPSTGTWDNVTEEGK